MFYFSKAIGNIQLFIEFFFEILNEKAEPLIAVVELVKSILKFREYRLLVSSENLNTYIEMESYHELKRIKEIKDKHFQLVRSKKTLPKLKNFKPSSKLEQLKRFSSAPIDNNIQGNTGAQMMQYGTGSEAEIVEIEEEQGVLKKVVYALFEMARKVIKTIFGFVFNHRYHIDDIINIFRPFIFVYLVMKHGRKSYQPIKISLMLDLISILISFSRLIQASNPEVHRKSN